MSFPSELLRHCEFVVFLNNGVPFFVEMESLARAVEILFFIISRAASVTAHYENPEMFTGTVYLLSPITTLYFIDIHSWVEL